MRLPRTLWLILALLGATLLPLLPTVLTGDTIGAFDSIRPMKPWSGPPSKQAWDVLQADSVLQFYPWRKMVLESWGRGEPPFWNPYELGGTPLLANSQSAGLYPPHVLLGALHVPVSLALSLLAWLHLFLAAFGVFKLTKRLGAEDSGALFAGLSFGLSAFMVAWVALPSVIETCAWIPWVVWSTLGLFEDKGLRRSAGWLAVGVAMMFLAGHLQFAAYGLMAGGIVALAMALGRSRSRLVGFGFWILAAGIGGCLAAPQLLPVLNYGKFSHRATSATMDGYQGYVSAGALKPFELASLVDPLALGDPREKIRDDGLSAYWPALAKRGANFAESAVGLGFVVLFLGVLSFRKLSKAAKVVGGVGLFAFLLALGTPLNMLLYFGVPGWAATGSLARVIVLFVLACSCLAGVGLSQLVDGFDPKKLKVGGVVFVGIALLTMVLAKSGASAPADVPAEGFEAVVSAAWLGSLPAFGALIVLAILALLAFEKHEKVRPWLPALAVLGFFVSNLMHIPPHGSPLDEVAGPKSERIAAVNSDWGLILPGKALLPPNTATSSKIHELGGYDSLMHRDTVGLIKDVDGEDPAPPANGNMEFIKPKADLRKLAEAGVTEIWSLKPLNNLTALPSTADGVFRYKLDGPGRVSSTGGPASLVSESLNSLEVSAQGPGVLTVRDRNMPGWTAKVDGQPAVIKEGVWRELELPPGQHTVVFRYVPPGFRNGLLMALVGLLGCLGFLVRGKPPVKQV